MKDRVPTYPGRVTLTPVSGEENTYDMIRADSPTEEGTALSKANLLPDDLAAELGLTTDATVADALEALRGMAGEGKAVTGSYTGTGADMSIELGFAPSFVAVSGNPSATSISDNSLKAYVSWTAGLRGVTEITLTQTGFTVNWLGANSYPKLSDSGRSYEYIAFR